MDHLSVQVGRRHNPAEGDDEAEMGEEVLRVWRTGEGLQECLMVSEECLGAWKKTG